MPMGRALVTGVSRGLGKYVATRLSEEGWVVLGLSRSRPSQLSAECLEVDLSTEASVGKIAEWCGECPDIVIHNAVTYPEPADIERPQLSSMESVFRVNAMVPHLLSHALLERKPRDKLSTIVLVNSDSIYHADNRSGLYAASKAAARVFATSLASTCRSLRASVSTLLLGPLADEKKMAQLRQIAQSRGMKDEEVVDQFLRRSNADLVIRELIDFESCYQSIKYIRRLGTHANGMLCRLDGGSAGSLV